MAVNQFAYIHILCLVSHRIMTVKWTQNPRTVSCCGAHLYLCLRSWEERGQHGPKAQGAATLQAAERCKGRCWTRSPTS